MKEIKNNYRIRGWMLPLLIAATALVGCDTAKPILAGAESASESAPAHMSDDTREKPRDPSRLWCNEHGLYEDECVLCHPELALKLSSDPHEHAHEENNAGRDPNRLWCGEHDVYEDECGICHPELLSGLPTDKRLKVRFSSNVSVEKAGIETGRANSASVSVASDMLGQVSFDLNKLAVITPLGKGVLREILVDVGDSVEAGQLLATLTSPAVAEAKSNYLNALSSAELRRENYAREKDLHEQKISARQDFEAAKAALAASQSGIDYARQTLINLGLREQEIEEVAQSRSRNSILPIRAPFSGTVVERDAVMGTAVEAGTVLFQVADLSTMWMELSIPETQLAGVQQGVAIQARFEAFPGLAFEGKLTWVAYSVDERTRMVKARAELANAQRLLRHGMFGRARLSGFAQTVGLTVPEEAVQVVDGQPVIFTKLEDDLFEIRPVQLGAARDGHVPVLAGISYDDVIVIAESYVIKSEFLKARLGAGCVDK